LKYFDKLLTFFQESFGVFRKVLNNFFFQFSKTEPFEISFKLIFTFHIWNMESNGFTCDISGFGCLSSFVLDWWTSYSEFWNLKISRSNSGVKKILNQFWFFIRILDSSNSFKRCLLRCFVWKFFRIGKFWYFFKKILKFTWKKVKKIWCASQAREYFPHIANYT
jgi:hypothetical protein